MIFLPSVISKYDLKHSTPKSVPRRLSSTSGKRGQCELGVGCGLVRSLFLLVRLLPDSSATSSHQGLPRHSRTRVHEPSVIPRHFVLHDLLILMGFAIAGTKWNQPRNFHFSCIICSSSWASPLQEPSGTNPGTKLEPCGTKPGAQPRFHFSYTICSFE